MLARTRTSEDKRLPQNCIEEPRDQDKGKESHTTKERVNIANI